MCVHPDLLGLQHVPAFAVFIHVCLHALTQLIVVDSTVSRLTGSTPRAAIGCPVLLDELLPDVHVPDLVVLARLRTFEVHIQCFLGRLVSCDVLVVAE